MSQDGNDGNDIILNHPPFNYDRYRGVTEAHPDSRQCQRICSTTKTFDSSTETITLNLYHNPTSRLNLLWTLIKWDRSYPWPFNHSTSSSFPLCSSEHAWYRYPTTITPSFMYMATMYPGPFRRSWRGSSSIRKDRAKQKVLDDREFPKHFGFVHFDHARVDFVPGFYLENGRTDLMWMVAKEKPSRTADISSSIGECHRRDAVLI